MNGEFIGFVSISVTSANAPFIGVEYSIRDSSSTPSVRGSGPDSVALLSVATLASTIAISIETVVDTGVVVEDEEGEVSEIKTYTAEFDCSVLPPDSYLVTDVEAFSADEKIIVSLKVAFESFDLALHRKQLELAQLNKSISELKDSSRQIRDNNKLRKSLSTKKPVSGGGGNSKVKKSKPTRAGSESGKASSSAGTQVSKSKSSPEKSSSFTLTALSQYALLGGALALEYRAVLLFPLAAAAIYFRGEVMSV